MHPAGPAVTIAIPAYRSEAIIRGAIDSALAQTHRAVEVIVSIDPADEGGEDRTEEICRTVDDERLRVIVQPRRLGWEGNCNALMDEVRTPYFVMLFHDDRMHPRFCEVLAGEMERDPQIVFATGAVDVEGEQSRRKAWDDITGDRFSRLLAVLTSPRDLYPHMALTRSGPVARRGLRVRRVGPHGYRSDILYIMELALLGTFRAVPEVLYVKHHGAETVSGGWRRLGAGVIFESEAELRALQIGLIAGAGFTADEQLVLIETVLARAEPMVMPHDNAGGAAYERQARLTAATVARLVSGEAATPLTDRAAARRFRAVQALRLADYMFKHGVHDAAQVFAAEAVAVDEGVLAAHLTAARTLLRDAAPASAADVALGHTEAAIALDPASAVAWRLHARALARLKRPAEAKAARETAAGL